MIDKLLAKWQYKLLVALILWALLLWRFPWDRIESIYAGF